MPFGIVHADLVSSRTALSSNNTSSQMNSIESAKSKNVDISSPISSEEATTVKDSKAKGASSAVSSEESSTKKGSITVQNFYSTVKGSSLNIERNPKLKIFRW